MAIYFNLERIKDGIGEHVITHGRWTLYPAMEYLNVSLCLHTHVAYTVECHRSNV